MYRWMDGYFWSSKCFRVKLTVKWGELLLRRCPWSCSFSHMFCELQALGISWFCFLMCSHHFLFPPSLSLSLTLSFATDTETHSHTFSSWGLSWMDAREAEKKTKLICECWWGKTFKRMHNAKPQWDYKHLTGEWMHIYKRDHVKQRSYTFPNYQMSCVFICTCF